VDNKQDFLQQHCRKSAPTQRNGHQALEKEVEELKDNTVARKSVAERPVWSKGGGWALVFTQE